MRFLQPPLQNRLLFRLSSLPGFRTDRAPLVKQVGRVMAVLLGIVLVYGVMKNLRASDWENDSLMRSWEAFDERTISWLLNLPIGLILLYCLLRYGKRKQQALAELNRQMRVSLEQDMKLTEEIMHGQVFKYGAIFQAAADGLLISNGQGLITEINPAACRLLGNTANQLIGQKYYSFLHAQDKAQLEQAHTHQDRSVSLESWVIRHDGYSTPVEVTSVLFTYMEEICRATMLKDITDRKMAETIIHTNREIENAINYFATSLFGQNTVDEILWDVAQNCISRLGFEDCVVYMLDETGSHLVQRAAFGPKNPKDFDILHPLVIPVGKGIVGSVAQSGLAEIVEDTLLDARYIVDDEARRCEITVPIIYQDRVIGIIDSEHAQKGFFQSKHLSILTTIASLCANKIVKVLAEEEARKAALKLAEYHQKTAEFKLMALRSQMNPHFIFNSLNSIQHLISENERKGALTYLTTFSKLLRKVLESSLNSQILLSDEIQILRNYLSMESLRFDDRFSYQIELDESIDAEDVEIPALLVQPYVENAIVHGLINKSATGRLLIRFENQGDHIHCIIEDNGIGRAAAAEIKSRRMVQHQSVGMKLSKERLELINGNNPDEVVVQITDLYDGERPAGTRVEIRIPNGYN